MKFPFSQGFCAYYQPNPWHIFIIMTQKNWSWKLLALLDFCIPSCILLLFIGLSAWVTTSDGDTIQCMIAIRCSLFSDDHSSGTQLEEKIEPFPNTHFAHSKIQSDYQIGINLTSSNTISSSSSYGFCLNFVTAVAAAAQFEWYLRGKGEGRSNRKSLVKVCMKECLPLHPSFHFPELFFSFSTTFLLA